MVSGQRMLGWTLEENRRDESGGWWMKDAEGRQQRTGTRENLREATGSQAQASRKRPSEARGCKENRASRFWTSLTAGFSSRSAV
jgi:hypothetical protein